MTVSLHRCGTGWSARNGTSARKNLVVLAGGTQNAWASDLANMSAQAVGVEFGVSSETSPGFEEVFLNENPAVVAAGQCLPCS